MSNVHGAHPGGCERQTRGSPSVTRMLHPGVHDTASCLSRVALVPRRNVRLKVAVQEFDPSQLLSRFVQLSVAISFLFQLSFRFAQLSVSFLYSLRRVFLSLAISKGFDALSKKCGSFMQDLDPVGVQF